MADAAVKMADGSAIGMDYRQEGRFTSGRPIGKSEETAPDATTLIPRHTSPLLTLIPSFPTFCAADR
jgi:hypothetical protein